MKASQPGSPCCRRGNLAYIALGKEAGQGEANGELNGSRETAKSSSIGQS